MKLHPSVRALFMMLAMTLAGCGATGPSLDPQGPPSKPVLVSGEGYEGAIFSGLPDGQLASPYTDEGRWTPTAQDVAAFEQGLRAYLEQRLARAIEREEDSIRPIRGILDNLHLFRRQYFGVVRGGARELFVNCFPNPATEGYDEDFEWLDGCVVVCDGGFWHWRARYDPVKREYLGLYWNGEA